MLKGKFVYFLNCTTGLEFLDAISKDCELHFTRIQSTSGEQGRWNYILNNVDNDFLMHLAIGSKCVFFDCTSRYGGRRDSRAIWQCIEWIKYAIHRCWFDEEIKCPYGQHKHFQHIYNHNLKKATKRRLRYFKRFVLTDKIYLKTVCCRTTHDSDFEYFRGEL